MCDCPWFRESVYLAACEQVFQWEGFEKALYRDIKNGITPYHVLSFCAYFGVIRNFVFTKIEAAFSILNRHMPTVAANPDWSLLECFARALKDEGCFSSRPLSAVSKLVLLYNPSTMWPPCDSNARAAVGVASFPAFYARVWTDQWRTVCANIDNARGDRKTARYSIARVFDKLLFLAGSERREPGAWRQFREHANALGEPERQCAQELADAIRASPEAVDLLKGLICDDARKALQRAHQRQASAPRSG